MKLTELDLRATQFIVALGQELPPRTSYAQALIFGLIIQAHAARRDIRVCDLPALAGASRHGQFVLGDGIRRTYQMFLPPSRKAPDGLGWVRLVRKPTDRRSKVLRLTKIGMAVAERVMGLGALTRTPALAAAPAWVSGEELNFNSVSQIRAAPRPTINIHFDARCGAHLFGGDCLDILPTLPDQSVDAVIVDPPYGVTRKAWDKQIPLEPLWAEIRRVLKPTGTVVMTATQPYASKLVTSNPQWFKYSMVWEKTKAVGFHHAWQMPLRNHEELLVFSPGVLVGKYRSQRQVTYNPQGIVKLAKPIVRKNPARKGKMFHRTPGKTTIQTHTNFPKSVLRIASVGKTVHTTQKPLELMRHLVLTYSNPGEVVLDFCMGSGTTGVAARMEGRRFIGIEREAKFFEIARHRFDGTGIAATDREPAQITSAPVLEAESISFAATVKRRHEACEPTDVVRLSWREERRKLPVHLRVSRHSFNRHTAKRELGVDPSIKSGAAGGSRGRRKQLDPDLRQ